MRNDLSRRIKEMQTPALDWIDRHLEYFNPLRYSQILKVDLAVKASAELALVCEYALSDHARSDAQHYRHIASYIWSEVFCTPAIQDYLLTTELGLLTFGFYASLRQCGYQDQRFETKLGLVLKDGYVLAAERIPTRDLDLIHSYKKLGISWNGKSHSEIYSRCLLAKHPVLYPLSVDDVYAITHTIFFITDFGRTRGCCSATDVSYLEVTLPRLLGFYLRKHNWDLVAELLLSLHATGLDHFSLYADAWRMLLSRQEQDGSFPGPTGENGGTFWGHTGQTDVGDTEWSRFHDNYHTTLVSLLASQAFLRRVSLRLE